MFYRISKIKFAKILLEKGHANISAFARSSQLHRNTINLLLSGKAVFVHAITVIAQELECDPMELLEPVVATNLKLPEIGEITPLVARLIQRDKKMCVVLFGSRASKKPKKYSDWDLGIFRHPKPIDTKNYLHLKELVENLSEDLVREVDLVNFNEAPTWFLAEIKSQPEYLAGSKESYTYLKGMIDGIHKKAA